MVVPKDIIIFGGTSLNEEIDPRQKERKGRSNTNGEEMNEKRERRQEGDFRDMNVKGTDLIPWWAEGYRE